MRSGERAKAVKHLITKGRKNGAQKSKLHYIGSSKGETHMNRPKFNLNPNNDDEKDNDKQKQELRTKQVQFLISYVIVSMIGLWLFQEFILNPLIIRETQIPYSEFKAKIQSGQIVSVTLGTDRYVGTMKNPDAKNPEQKEIPFTVTAMPNGDPTLITELDKAGVTYQVSPPPSPVGNFL